MDLDYVPHSTEGAWGIIFRGALKQGKRTIYIGVEKTEKQTAATWNVLLRTISVNAASCETVYDVEGISFPALLTESKSLLTPGAAGIDGGRSHL